MKIKTMYLTVSQAKELNHLGFIIKFVTYTRKGMLWDIWVNKAI